MSEQFIDIERTTVEQYYNRLLRAPYDYKFLHFKFLWELLHVSPAFSSICKMINQAAGNRFDINAYEVVAQKRKLLPNIFQGTDERLHFCYKVLEQTNKVGTSDHEIIYQIAELYDNDLSWNSQSRFALFNDLFLEPFIFHLFSQLDKNIVILSYLKKYKQRSEWFNKKRLYTFATTHSSTLEDELTSDLYRYLFDKGFDFSIEPYSPSGRLDFLAAQKNAKTKYVIEGKVFDATGRGKSYIIKGINQTLEYLNAYNENIGYLTIYNICNSSLAFHLDNSTDGHSIYSKGNKTVYLFVIDIYDDAAPASKRKRDGTVKISYVDFDEQS